MIELPQLILASNSPRRAEILTNVGWPFIKRVREVDESVTDGESPRDYVMRLSAEKARAVGAEGPGETILGADTTVVVGDQIIGKPEDKDDAARMLRLLSGREHSVFTGVSIVRGEDVITDAAETVVEFYPMSDAEIDMLVELGDPLDKAGAYAVQAQAALFIKGICGDYWNVVGLPVNLVYRLVNSLDQSKRSTALPIGTVMSNLGSSPPKGSPATTPFLSRTTKDGI